MRLRNGVDLPEGRSAPAEVMIVGYLPATLKLSKGPNEGVWLRVVLREGKKRQIRHMTAAVGYPTLRLLRWSIGPLTLGDLELGQARPLTVDEINALRKLAGLTTIKETKGPPRKGSSGGRTNGGRTPTGKSGAGPSGGPAKRIRLVAGSKTTASAARSRNTSRPAAGSTASTRSSTRDAAKPSAGASAGTSARPSAGPSTKSSTSKSPAKSPATNRPPSAKPGAKGTSGGPAKSPKKEQRRG